MKYAIDRGYRHIDTGLTYGSEKDIGVALKEKIAEGVIKREDMFITTKVMPNEYQLWWSPLSFPIIALVYPS